MPRFTGGIVISVLADNGDLKFYKLITTMVTGSGPTTQKTINTSINMVIKQLAIVAIPIAIIALNLLSVVVLKRKKKQKIKK